MTETEAMAIAVASGSDGSEVINYLTENFPKEISEFTNDDFLDTEMPYEYIDIFKYDSLKRSQIYEKVKARAAELKIGVRTFEAMYKNYKKEHPDAPNEGANVTQFPGQPFALECGDWICDARGVRIELNGERKWACLHPIMPTALFTNLNSGTEKVEVAYCVGTYWKTAIFDRKTLSSASKIIDLSDFGIAASSENASLLVKYFLTVIQSNIERLPQLKSVTALGWTSDGEFVPYAKNIEFDGEKDFITRYKSVTTKGDLNTWFDCIADNVFKNQSAVSKTVIFASLASALVKPLGANNFWIHVWGTTGTGKTVLERCAASVWGNPTVGKFITSFNSTVVGNERGAAFCGSLPYIIDELQIIDSRKDMDSLIYMLTEGCGRSRGNKSGGLDYVLRWKNCVISSGERPINANNCGGGAAARVIEIEAKNKLFGEDANIAAIIGTITENYGHFGKLFIKWLKTLELDEVRRIQQNYASELARHGIMDKQAQSGALIMTAGKIVADALECESWELKLEEILPFLKSNEDVDANRRAYDYICGKIVENQKKFFGEVERQTDLWGKFENDGTASVIKTRFDEICKEGGYAPKPLISWLKTNGLLILDSQNNPTVTKYIGSKSVRCVVIKINQDESSDSEDYDF